ncbi:MAG TPA: outer membrane beta-barrel protein [Coxiellaceae bacterium]|nr:outer membrane beta-barrel protein [Coxiellaceae bacterium]
MKKYLYLLGWLPVFAGANPELPMPSETQYNPSQEAALTAQNHASYLAPEPEAVSDNHFYISGKAGVGITQLSGLRENSAPGTASVTRSPSVGVDPVLGLGIGHTFKHWFVPLRMELNYLYIDKNRFHADTNVNGTPFQNNLAVYSNTVMLDAFYDWDFALDWTLFVGGGAGLAHHRFHVVRQQEGNPSNYQSFDDSDDSAVAFSWDLWTGVSYDLSKRTAITLAYRFLDNGAVRSGNVEDGTSNKDDFSARLRRHLIMASFDYYY